MIENTTMSTTFTQPYENTIALEPVATGNIKANDVAMAAGNMRYIGFSCSEIACNKTKESFQYDSKLAHIPINWRCHRNPSIKTQSQPFTKRESLTVLQTLQILSFYFIEACALCVFGIPLVAKHRKHCQKLFIFYTITNIGR